MIAVIFETEPCDGDAYFARAAELRPLLDAIDGFISITQWRNIDAHRAAQAEGRANILRDYRLRIAEVVRDYGMNERAQAPGDSYAAHQTLD
jgi:heme-degrading monooxygenase HmoA